MKKPLPNLFLAGFLLGILYWLLESLLHAYVFHSGPLRQTLFGEHDPNELWMRALVTGLLTAFGWAAERIVRSERQQKIHALRLNRLFDYVHRISQQMESRFQTFPNHASPTTITNVDDSLLDEVQIAQIVRAVQELSRHLDSRVGEVYALLELTHEINKGMLVDEVLDKVYESFRCVIPYNRIGVAILSADGTILTSRWARSDYGQSMIPPGFSAPLAGSSLQRIIETGEPRIINDLAAYLAKHTSSKATKLIVAEGIRSSMTCPLVASGKAIGFIFFSSCEAGTYRNAHSDVFKLIAGQLSVVIEKSHTYQLLIEEKEKSDALLLNVMPARILSRVRAGTVNPVEEIDIAGVMFADIVGFTDIARRFPAVAVTQFLQEVFTQFDLLCERHGIEKIKTIGDAYMACAIGSSSDGGYLANLARFAIDAANAAGKILYPNGKPLKIRIGLHAGPVIAGVIGQKKFAYDIWGDTVNLAQRLESTSIAGRIHVSERVKAVLADQFALESRGLIDLKGEGVMHTYFLA